MVQRGGVDLASVEVGERSFPVRPIRARTWHLEFAAQRVRHRQMSVDGDYYERFQSGEFTFSVTDEGPG